MYLETRGGSGIEFHLEKSGQLVDVGTLAREYGFTDIDGTQPPPFRIPAST